MNSLYSKAFAFGLSVAFVATQGGAAQTRSGANSLRSASKNPVSKEGVVEPAAVDALKAMSAYLTTASTLGITSQGSLDVVTNDGQRIQLDGTTQYKIRRPGFVIDYASDLKSRRQNRGEEEMGGARYIRQNFIAQDHQIKGEGSAGGQAQGRCQGSIKEQDEDKGPPWAD